MLSFDYAAAISMLDADAAGLLRAMPFDDYYAIIRAATLYVCFFAFAYAPSLRWRFSHADAATLIFATLLALSGTLMFFIAFFFSLCFRYFALLMLLPPIKRAAFCHAAALIR